MVGFLFQTISLRPEGNRCRGIIDWSYCALERQFFFYNKKPLAPNGLSRKCNSIEVVFATEQQTTGISMMCWGGELPRYGGGSWQFRGIGLLQFSLCALFFSLPRQTLGAKYGQPLLDDLCGFLPNNFNLAICDLSWFCQFWLGFLFNFQPTGSSQRRHIQRVCEADCPRKCCKPFSRDFTQIRRRRHFLWLICTTPNSVLPCVMTCIRCRSFGVCPPQSELLAFPKNVLT